MAASNVTACYGMAFLYKRGDSKFWWIGYVDLAGKTRKQSTHLRYDVPEQHRAAIEFRRKMAAEEKYRLDARESWGAWVPRFLKQRYADRPFTYGRYKNSWRNLEAFLRSHAIYVPRQLSRQHVRDYIDWRQTRHAELGVFEVCKNTALHEVKLLRVLMHEAVISGFAPANPCARLDIAMDPVARKPRITEAEHQKIVKALRREPDWMRVSYLIAWHQGCRFSETRLELSSQVDIHRGIIRFRTKGYKASLAEFPLARELVPMFRQMKARGQRWTFEMPAMPGKAWWKFFRRNKLRHLCFHCTRVTFITRCYESGIPRDMVMRLASHSTSAAHEIYPRLEAGEELIQSFRARL